MEPNTDTESLSAPGVLEKFQTAGRVAQTVLADLISKCVPGADIHSLCLYGSNRINEECAKVFATKKFPKGIAFPVSIAPNDICGHFSPLKDESVKLAAGDLIKIDFGVHIDGFPVMLAHSLIVGKTEDALKLKAATAAYKALELAVKSLKPGVTNSHITATFNNVAAAYGTQTLEGVLGHSVRRYLIDSNDVIILKETPEQKVANYEFKVNDVFTLDVFVTANEVEGKTKEGEQRVTIFKQIPDAQHDVKTKSAKKLLSEVNNRFFGFGFTLNDFEDELVKSKGSPCRPGRVHQVRPLPAVPRADGEVEVPRGPVQVDRGRVQEPGDPAGRRPRHQLRAGQARDRVRR